MACSSDRSIVSKDDAGGGLRLAPAFGSRRPMNGSQRIQSHRNSFLDSSLVRTQISLLRRGWHFKFIGILNHDVTHGTHHLRSEEHTSELQSLMRISYAVFCLKKQKIYTITT